MTNLGKHEGLNMRPRWKRAIWIAPLAILGIALFVFIGGEVVMRLWNWLLPPLFGWRVMASGKGWEFWRCAGSSSADLDTTVRVAPAPAVGLKSAWKSAADT